MIQNQHFPNDCFLPLQFYERMKDRKAEFSNTASVNAAHTSDLQEHDNS